MALYPVFGIKTVLLLVSLVAIAAIILVAVGKRGMGVLKKQAVAWVLTIVMVCVSIGIGYARAPVNNPAPSPDYPSETIPPAAANSCVWDDANVLSDRTVRALDQRNDRLWDNYGATIGVVTCNYGYDDLDEYGRDCAVEMGLGDYDMIVVLDISGENYWLLRGAGLERALTDRECTDYAYDYMEDYFARGMYDDAVLDLTEALEAWYGVYYA